MHFAFDPLTFSLLSAWIIHGIVMLYRKPKHVPSAIEVLHHEMARNPNRTKRIAAYLKANPDCRSFREAAKVIDAQ